MFRLFFQFLLIFMGLSLSLADAWPITVNLKTGKTVLLNPDFSWSYYVPPVPRLKLGFHQVDFGASKAQFYTIYAKKKSTMKESPEDGVVYFDDVIEGYPATLFFYFKKGIFFHGEAVLKLVKPKDDDFTKAFATFEKSYIKRFGKPKNDSRLFKEWSFEGYKVRLVLTSQNKRLFLATIFEDEQVFSKIVPAVVVVPTINVALPAAPTAAPLPPPPPVAQPVAKPMTNKTMDVEQLKELIDAL